jgi:hypothetical protein
MTTTDLSKKQLTTILSALDDASRNPANKGEALRAIGRSAQRFGLTAEDVLAAAPGLLDGRMSPADFRVELHDQGAGTPAAVTEAPQAAPDAQDADTAPQAPQASSEPAQAAEAPATASRKARATVGKATAAKAAKLTEAVPADKPTPRAGTKQAHMIEMLKRPEGATVEQIAKATGWQHHTVRGAIAGALKKKLGLTVEATRTREVGPEKTGAKRGTTVYRIIA